MLPSIPCERRLFDIKTTAYSMVLILIGFRLHGIDGGIIESGVFSSWRTGGTNNESSNATRHYMPLLRKQ